ncbi:MAG TPA: tetratricopeptide repeat protein [Bryobacteraceae bacterium]|nr:tetratricopeptide repeat protein [Bryobacteraceae bacterium]
MNTATPLAAKAGDLLFAGDGFRSSTSPATLLYCPGKIIQTLDPAVEVRLEQKQVKVVSGKLGDQKPAGSCFLPQTVRIAAASQQHYGVSMTRGLTKPELPPPIPIDKLAPAVVAELSAIQNALAANPADTSALVARAAIFEKHDLLANALADYRSVGGVWNDAVWIKGKIFEIEEALAARAAVVETPPGGKVFALLVGISKYQKLPQDLWLQYSAADALAFEKHFRSPRGGALPAENLLTFTDEKATTAALRNAFQTFLKGRAGKKDTIFIMIAGHGTVEIPGNRGAFVLTYDSDPQDLTTTALPMAEVQALVQQELSKVGRVALFVDVCRAGSIGSIRSTTINSAVERLGEADGEIFGFMASRPKELSYEGPQFGGGHGAFSYFLLKGLNGDADKNKDSIVNVNEIIGYVAEKVAAGTNDKQHPRDFGNMDNTVPLADVRQPGLELSHWRKLWDYRNGEPVLLAAQQPASAVSADTQRDIDRFLAAIASNRLLPDQPDNAFAILRSLEGRLTPAQYLHRQNELRIALENAAQQVLLRYLTGDQIPQTQSEFASGAKYVSAAMQLTPESLFLAGREAFFRGRALVFDKQYPQAADLLERAVRIDPAGAYSYNALGIAYLEQADYARAIPAFQDASRLAPLWSYPLHNLALAYSETGNYRASIRAYEQAMRLTPQFSYLPYNLGLVYQRLNRRKEAEMFYRRASALSPDAAEPYNALGSLKAVQGKAAEAEKLYKLALDKNPQLLAARHNLALLLARQRDRQNEAAELWRENLRRAPTFIASRISLAELLAARGETAAAIQEYREVLTARPEYLAARIALADLLSGSGDHAGALEQLATAAKSDATNPAILERLGDVHTTMKHAAEAKAAYEAALQNAPDRAARKRIRAKLNR